MCLKMNDTLKFAHLQQETKNAFLKGAATSVMKV